MKNVMELQRAAWEALVRALGVADAWRYHLLFEPGQGDDAAEREQLFGQTTLDDWVRESRRQADVPEPDQTPPGDHLPYPTEDLRDPMKG